MADFFPAALLPSQDPELLALIVIFLLLSGIIKGFLGIGLPAAGMALLTLIMPPTEAIALLWVPIIVSNAWQFSRATGRRAIIRDYRWFAGAIFCSILVTSMFIAMYPTALLTVAIGFAMIVFAANQLFGLALPIKAGRPWQIGLGVAAGILGGLSSIWSPPVAMYLLATNTSKERFIGATGFLFLSGCLPLGAGLILSGLLGASIVLKSLLGLVVVLVGFQIGERLRGRISQEMFRRFVLFGFLVMGLRLVATSLI
jgi:uncharacterized membrane protein YfcA